MTVLVAKDVSKRYRRLAAGTPRTLRSLAERSAVSVEWALRDITFDVEAGESFGIIGANGSGKSTLLRILAGVTRQSEGEVRVDGDVGALLGLGGGFHPMLTAEENALTGALLAGLTKEEAADRLPAITDFAGLADEMRQPLRMLSDGQKMRLAFSVAIHTDPQILLVDEVLAVGDLRFQEKCFARLDELRSGGVTTVIVSHDLAQVRRLADRAMWLDGGEIRQIGTTTDVSRQYERAMHGDPVAEPLEDGGWRVGTRRLEILRLRVLDASGRETARLESGGRLIIEIEVEAHSTLSGVIFSFGMHSRGSEQVCLDLDTETDQTEIGDLPAGRHTLTLDVDRLDLSDGSYLVDFGAYSSDWAETYDYLWGATALEVVGRGKPGLLSPPRDWRVS